MDATRPDEEHLGRPINTPPAGVIPQRSRFALQPRGVRPDHDSGQFSCALREGRPLVRPCIFSGSRAPARETDLEVPVLLPKLFTTLRSYDRRQFVADVIAGVIVAVVALPLSIAFAIASGVGPEAGLYTAIVAGFLIAALGGSRVQIGGPTGAFVVVVYGVVAAHGTTGLAIATVMAGVMLIALGLARLGGAIKFIPHPVVTGFTSGIAVVILSSQVKDLLGLEMGAVPAEFIPKWAAIGRALPTVDGPTVAIAAGSLLILGLWPRVSRRVPAPLVALIVAAVAVRYLGLDVETIGTRFGEIRIGLPRPRMIDIDWSLVPLLTGPAISIALLGGIESLLSAVVADGMIGARHRSNMELVAQGVANVASPFFGGIPATGAIARTATNVKNGGRTPVAGMVHALALLAIALFLGPLVAWVPLAALAAILVVVSYHMSEWRVFVAEFSAPRSDIAVLLATFLLTVLVDLTVAIQVGMVLAAFLFMRRMAEVTNVSAISREFREANGDVLTGRDIPAGVHVYEISGPFFFGAAEKFKDQIGHVASRPRALILGMRDVPAIDSTGLHALTQIVKRSHREGILVLLSGVHAQPMMAIGRTALLDMLGEESFVGSIDEGLRVAREYLAAETILERVVVDEPEIGLSARK
jgi:SulP family sulfate permease